MPEKRAYLSTRNLNGIRINSPTGTYSSQHNVGTSGIHGHSRGIRMTLAAMCSLV